LSTPANKLEPARRKWQPIMSLVTELSSGGTPQQTSLGDRFRSTRKIFYAGVMHGLRRMIVHPEAAVFLAGDMQMVGVFMEGEAIGLAVADRIMPWRASAWTELRTANMHRHPYEMHTGFGMAHGILGSRLDALFDVVQPACLWRWFAVDGFGFQQALCNPEKYLRKQEKAKFAKLPEYASRVFDQGLGRSFWFLFNGDVDQVAEQIKAFDASRQSDLWIGTGVAAAHTGGSSRESLERLVALSGTYRKHLAVGASVASHVRSIAGTKCRVTDDICVVLTGLPSERASAIVESAHSQVDQNDLLGHARWQQSILDAM
jgi:hypothetical protein